MKRIFWAFLAGLPFTGLSAQSSYTLKAGETLYSVAKRYGVSVDELMNVNSISEGKAARAGMSLTIPGVDLSESTATQIGGPITYLVHQGDTYYSIARGHGISVVDLLKALGRAASVPLITGETLHIEHATMTNVAPVPVRAPNRVATKPEAAEVVRSEPVVSNDVSYTEYKNLKWPVSGVVTPYLGKQKGVKIDVAGQQSIRAVASGTVVYEGPYRELGRVVLVDHPGGYIYIYGGSQNVFVRVGQQVKPGTVLGRMDGGENKAIFSVFKDANPIDPLSAPRD